MITQAKISLSKIYKTAYFESGSNTEQISNREVIKIKVAKKFIELKNNFKKK